MQHGWLDMKHQASNCSIWDLWYIFKDIIRPKIVKESLYSTIKPLVFHTLRISIFVPAPLTSYKPAKKTLIVACIEQNEDIWSWPINDDCNMFQSGHISRTHKKKRGILKLIHCRFRSRKYVPKDDEYIYSVTNEPWFDRLWTWDRSYRKEA